MALPQRPQARPAQRPAARPAQMQKPVQTGISKFRQAMKAAPKTALVDRVSEAYETKEKTGKFGLYLKDLKNPIWKPKNGIHIIDIIPFLSGGADPNPKVKQGDMVYRIDVFTHSNVGCTEDRVLCLARTYGKPCPICEYISSQYANENPETLDVVRLKKMDAKRRVVYNVLISGDTASGVHIFEVSHYLFDIELSTMALNKRTGNFYPFHDPDNGMSIGFEKSGEGVGTKYKGFERIERSGPISDAVLEQAAILDLHLDVMSYKELKEKFYDSGADGGAEEPMEEVTDFEDGDDDIPTAEEITDFEDDVPY